MPPITVNIKQAQVCVYYEDDEELQWHHRILLHRCSAGIWVCLTPDFELCVHDLRTMRHVVLGRASLFPDTVYGNVYIFDPVAQRDVNEYLPQARTQALILADTGDAEAVLPVWVVSDPSDEKFGQIVPAETVEDGDLHACLAHRGVAEFEEEIRFVTQMDQSVVENFIQVGKATRGDDRLLGLHLNGQGRRHLPLHTAVHMFDRKVGDDWPHEGPSAVVEFLQSVVTHSGSLITYDTEWARISGVPEASSARHEHRIICETLRLAIEYDQRDVTNNASDENLVRRLIQLEAAVGRNPLHPDFGGLGLMLTSPVSESGAAQAPSFNHWVADRQKTQAQVMKQARVQREEKQAELRRRKNPKGDGKGKPGKPGGAAGAAGGD